MRLYTVLVNGEKKVAVEKNEKLVTLDSLNINVADMNEVILKWEILEDKIKEKVALETSYVDEYTLLSPIEYPMQDVLCIGVNYKEHLDETKVELALSDDTPAVYFSKRVSVCNKPFGLIPNYSFVNKLDYEVELGVILKKDALNIKKEEAKDYIFGYTVINDISARDIQTRHKQWYRGKSLDGFYVMGPCIVTADEIADPHNLNLTCTVNGDVRQKSNTKYMITTVEAALEELSTGMTLRKGTVIASGTPGGVGMGMNPPCFLKSKDKVVCSIEGIGAILNTVE